MIDPRARSQLAEAARALVAGRITNDEFERRIPCSTDPAVREIFAKGSWPQCGDLTEHRLIGPEKWVGEKREFATRCILFLKSDLPYSWPTQSLLETFARLLANIFTLGTLGHLDRQQLETMGHTSAWPFRSQSTLQPWARPLISTGADPASRVGLIQALNFSRMQYRSTNETPEK